MMGPTVGIWSDQNFASLGNVSQMGGQIHRITHDRIILLAERSDTPGNDQTGVDAKVSFQMKTTGLIKRRDRLLHA